MLSAMEGPTTTMCTITSDTNDRSTKGRLPMAESGITIVRVMLSR